MIKIWRNGWKYDILSQCDRWPNYAHEWYVGVLCWIKHAKRPDKMSFKKLNLFQREIVACRNDSDTSQWMTNELSDGQGCAALRGTFLKGLELGTRQKRLETAHNKFTNRKICSTPCGKIHLSFSLQEFVEIRDSKKIVYFLACQWTFLRYIGTCIFSKLFCPRAFHQD